MRDFIAAARTLVGRAAIATAAGPAHHGAVAKRSVANHAYASTAMHVRETAVAQAWASGDSCDEEEEYDPEESEDPEGDGLSVLLLSGMHL